MNLSKIKLVIWMDIGYMEIGDTEWQELGRLDSIIWKIKYILRNW